MKRNPKDPKTQLHEYLQARKKSLPDYQVLDILGTLDSLSMFNPALPIRARVYGDAYFHVGCVDVTSEGGAK